LIPEADTLQSLRPSLHRIELGPPVAMPLPGHLLVQAGGEPRPPHLPLLAQRSVSLHGPWRSVLVAAELLGPAVAWQRLAVEVEEVRDPSLTQSAFLASLHGVRYENQTPATPVYSTR